jgi:hypothetical protein
VPLLLKLGTVAHSAASTRKRKRGNYRRLAATHGTNPAKVSVARKLLICAWHMLSRDQVFNPSRSTNAAASSLCFQAA